MIKVPTIANPNRRPVTELGTSVYEPAEDAGDAVGVIVPRNDVGDPGCSVMTAGASFKAVIVVPPRKADVVAFTIGAIGAIVPGSGVGTVTLPLSIVVGLAVGLLGSLVFDGGSGRSGDFVLPGRPG